MVKSFSTFATITLFTFLLGLVTIGGAFAQTNTTMNTTASSRNLNLFQPTMISDGHQVFYVVIDNDNRIHPATSAQVRAIDAAIADGTIAQVNFDRNRARGPQ